MDVLNSLRTATCILLALVTTGCHRAAVYHPSSLPAEYIAPPVTSRNSVDLSRIAHSLGDNEMLYIGDVVAVTISTGLETEPPAEWRGRIAEDGTVNIPLVGSVPIAGLKLPYAERLIHSESISRGKYINPNVTLTVAARRSNSVTIVGEVQKPGTYQLPVSHSNVLAAISAAEGLSPNADAIIEVRHAPDSLPGSSGDVATGPAETTSLAGFRNRPAPATAVPRSVRIDLQNPEQMDASNFLVGDGSTVMVMKRGKRYVHVMGLVRKPDQFEMPDDQEMRLLDAIAKANGRTLEIADKVRVIRNIPDRPEPVIVEISMREAKQNMAANIRLAPGDVVSVEETPTTMLIGTVREFVRFGFTAGIPGL